jgi:hypothetical protein
MPTSQRRGPLWGPALSNPTRGLYPYSRKLKSVCNRVFMFLPCASKIYTRYRVLEKRLVSLSQERGKLVAVLAHKERHDFWGPIG